MNPQFSEQHPLLSNTHFYLFGPFGRVYRSAGVPCVFAYIFSLELPQTGWYFHTAVLVYRACCRGRCCCDVVAISESVESSRFTEMASPSPSWFLAEVHAMLDAFLPPDTYYRFNPYMSEDIAMDDSRQERLKQLQTEGLRYLGRNEEKLKKASRILTREKSSVQMLAEWARLKAGMYNGVGVNSPKL